MKIDRIDSLILEALQRDGGLSQRDLAQQVGISQNACWRRVNRLRETGVLRGTTVRLDTVKLGLDLVVFMLVRTRFHDKTWSVRFLQRVESIPEIVEVHRIGGEWDYLLKAVTSGMAGYDRVYQDLITALEIEKVTGLFSMEQVLSDRIIQVKPTGD